MLLQLNIRNIALIDKLTIEFGEGMNCLTGETGAGKSIIIDSISCMLGGRTSRDTIRTGCDTASVQGVFSDASPLVTEILTEFGMEPEEDHTLILYREFNAAGRNLCRINGRTATISMLKRIGEALIDIHGQHDNQSLLRPDSHMKLLDLFGGSEIQTILQNYRKKLEIFKETLNTLQSLNGDPKERARLADLLSYQINEIERANLTAGEDDELNEQRMILANGEKIAYGLNKAYEIILADHYENASLRAMVNVLRNEIAAISGYCTRYEEILEKIEEMSYLLEDISSMVSSEKDAAVYEPSMMEQVEERIDEINRLKRKYGGTIEDILCFAQEARQQLALLSDSESRCQELLTALSRMSQELLNLCEDLNFARAKVSKLLEEKICKELEELEMRKTKFRVQIDYRSDENSEDYPEFTKNGLDEVEFLISANPGEPLKPLAKIASGGELSRIMLAIKTILADVDKISTLIFDEIDTGISGQAARKVGEKMKWISRRHQVICVTHHAQIAAIADYNIYIKKQFDQDRTTTEAKLLNYQEKIQEIGRLLDGGSASEITLEHAKALIDGII